MTRATLTANPLAPLRQKVQVLRRQVPRMADDETWRAFLGLTTGVTSTRAMSEAQLRAAVEALHKAGAPRTAPARAKALARPRYADTAQIGKIRALWITAHQAGAVRDPSEPALVAFMRRVTRQDIGVLSPRDANGVIEAIKAMIARTGGKAQG